MEKCECKVDTITVCHPFVPQSPPPPVTVLGRLEQLLWFRPEILELPLLGVRTQETASGAAWRGELQQSAVQLPAGALQCCSHLACSTPDTHTSQHLLRQTIKRDIEINLALHCPRLAHLLPCIPYLHGSRRPWCGVQ